MALRGYDTKDFALEYDATRDPLINGFHSLSDGIPPGFTIKDAISHTIVSVTSGSGAGQFSLHNGTFALSNSIFEAGLVAGTRSDLSFFAFPPLLFNNANNPFGLLIQNGPILTGRFIIAGTYYIIEG